jgi:HAD superfamily hydrolase (TIGR01509 family)
MSAVIFDMDGVLVDSEPLHMKVEQEFFRDHGLPVDEAEHETYVGSSTINMFTWIARRHPTEWNRLDMTPTEAARLEQGRYEAVMHQQGVPEIPGAAEIMRTLHSRGLKIAVASSAPHRQIDYVLEKLACRDIVECVLSGEDVPHSKPDPAIYLATARCLKVPPETCWVIEDSDNGITAAKAAGMACISYRNHTNTQADTTVTSLHQIPDLIRPQTPQ